MKVLDLFAGTHSVSKVCKEKGYEVISLDLEGADINISILDWNYKEYPVGYFDIIFASPPCNTFSRLRDCHIGRKLINIFGDEIVTREILHNDMIQNGLPLLRKAQEIIKYFKPDLWFIENPQTGRMKNYLDDVPYYDVDYCKYSDWGYRKRTRIWTNKKDFIPLNCCNDCDNMLNGKHRVNMANAFGGGNNKKNLRLKYRIPPKLINALIS